MKTFFEYCFYRSAKFYKRWEHSYHVSGKFALFLALYANVLTLISIFCAIFDTSYGLDIIYLIGGLFGILQFFILDKRKYKELEKRYKGEKNSKLKGWLVFAYIVISVVVYALSLELMY